jgi:hypothetical protein
VTFPEAPMGQTLEMVVGSYDPTTDPDTWPWVDISTYLMPGRGTRITVGRAPSSNQAPPAQLTVYLKNPDGRFTKGNPASPYAPYVRKNTPIRYTEDPGVGTPGQYIVYATTWQPTLARGGRSPKLIVCQLTAHGITRRIGQGSPPLRSPLYRARHVVEPVAAWSLTDGNGADVAASEILGGNPMAPSGTVTFGSAPGTLTGTEAIAVLGDGSLHAAITPAASTGYLAFSVWFRAYADLHAGFAVDVFRATGLGGFASYRIVLIDSAIPPAGVLLNMVDNTGAGLLGGDTASGTPGRATNPFDTAWHEVFCDFTQSGGNVVIRTYLDGTLADTETKVGYTLGGLTGVTVCNDPYQGNIEFGPVSYYTSPASPSYAAGDGYSGELVTDRITRLGAELDIPVDIVGTSDRTMGPQPTGAALDLFREAEAVDLGMLVDGLANGGITYVCLEQRYNRPTDLTINMALGDLGGGFTPTDTDDGIRNDETVSRSGGGSVRFVDQDSVDRIGTYADATTVNVADDRALLDQAGWRPHLSPADDEYRYPGLELVLHARPDLIPEWLAAGLNSRITVTNLPADLGTVDDLDLVVEGYASLVVNRRSWRVAANCTPYGPYRVAELEDADFELRLDTDASTLDSGYSAGAVSLAVSHTGPRWITTAEDAASFPFDIEVDPGWRITVTGITGAGTSQTFAVAPIPAALTAGAALRVADPAVLAM